MHVYNERLMFENSNAEVHGKFENEEFEAFGRLILLLIQTFFCLTRFHWKFFLMASLRRYDTTKTCR